MTSQERFIILQDLLPGSLQGWGIDKTTPLTSRKDLYGYINGGAELYISYGFKEALSCTYKKENQPEVLAEVYDLLESRNAFGVFSQIREKENLKLGQGAFSMPGAVFFWKDHYYISLSTQESSPETEAFILTLGDYISKKISFNGDIPALVNLLPEEGLAPFGYMHFHHYIWLNSYYFISDNNILNIDDGTNAVLAKYGAAENRQYLLLVQYINNDKADEAFDSFGRSLFPDGLTGNCIHLKDDTWLAASLSGNMIAAVFNGTERQSVNKLLINVLEKIRSLNQK